MATSEDGEDTLRKRYDDLCLDLNMDSGAQEEAWDNFEIIRQNYTLEGESLHWLACALYVSCRNTVVQTVGSGSVEGNFVSLTRLLRSTKLSVLEFFKKIRKWANMASLPQEMREKVDKLERNFAVSSVIFKKYEPIFLDIFLNPADDPHKPPRSRKQKRLPCTVTELFKYAWTMFVQVKGYFRAISDDLVNSYHLLLCCIDWLYVNALLSNRRDLLNPAFSGLPENFKLRDYKPPTEVPCVIQLLCEKHDGVIIEAKGIKAHWWSPHIKKLFDKKVLKGKIENLTGILEIGNFEPNVKSTDKKYEEYVLNVGDFDERVFLDPKADLEIGTPVKPGTFPINDIHEQVKKSLSEKIVKNSRLALLTPLTGCRYLEKNTTSEEFTPVTTATQSVHRLQSLLLGRKPGPGDVLLELYQFCSKNPKEEISQRLKEMGERFCKQYSEPNHDLEESPTLDFAKKRLQFAEYMYYKVLENIMINEKNRLHAKDPRNIDLTGIMEQDEFHRTLIACCLEIVIYSYNSQRIFPWIVQVFSLDAFLFHKVIELVIRGEEGLSRDVVKHLSYIEELILECEAWKSKSPLWNIITSYKKDHEGRLPSVEEVNFPNQIEHEGHSSAPASAFNSPVLHPAVKRIAGDNKGTSLLRKDLLQSPTGPTAVNFTSPMPGTTRRRLFDGPTAATTSSSVTTPTSGGTPEISSPKPKTLMYQTQTEDGTKMLIQIPMQMLSPSKVIKPPQGGALEMQSENRSPNIILSPSSQGPNKPKRKGSFTLFLRKFYHLASVRLQDLCDKLDIDSELHRQIWTCFEYLVMNHNTLLRDRHLDQLLMCAIYVVGKVTRKDRSFQDIVRCYRLQPQAQSHVYRSILLHTKHRHTSKDSDQNKEDDGSTINSDTDKPKSGKKSKDPISFALRSISALPAPAHGNTLPTPTHMAGTESEFLFEDRDEQRGDLIHFYNKIFVDKVKDFALKFAVNDVEGVGRDVPVLSPLPLARGQQQSPRRISSKHSVFVSQHESRDWDSSLTPKSKLLYRFNRSPATDLRAINKMLQMNEKGQQASKRAIDMSDTSPAEGPAIKKLQTSSPMYDTDSPMYQRLQLIMSERKATNGLEDRKSSNGLDN